MWGSECGSTLLLGIMIVWRFGCGEIFSCEAYDFCGTWLSEILFWGVCVGCIGLWMDGDGWMLMADLVLNFDCWGFGWVGILVVEYLVLGGWVV